MDKNGYEMNGCLSRIEFGWKGIQYGEDTYFYIFHSEYILVIRVRTSDGIITISGLLDLPYHDYCYIVAMTKVIILSSERGEDGPARV